MLDPTAALFEVPRVNVESRQVFLPRNKLPSFVAQLSSQTFNATRFYGLLEISVQILKNELLCANEEEIL